MWPVLLSVSEVVSEYMGWNADQSVLYLSVFSPPHHGLPAGSVELLTYSRFAGHCGHWSGWLFVGAFLAGYQPTMHSDLSGLFSLSWVHLYWPARELGFDGHQTHSICRETKHPHSCTSLLQEFCHFCLIPKAKHTHTTMYSLMSAHTSLPGTLNRLSFRWSIPGHLEHKVLMVSRSPKSYPLHTPGLPVLHPNLLTGSKWATVFCLFVGWFFVLFLLFMLKHIQALQAGFAGGMIL